MKFGHIVKYCDVFFKFDNGPYGTMLSAVMALCFENSRFKLCPLSKSNSFDQNFMKLCHIFQYHDVFFKFDNDLYGIMP